MKLSSHRTKTTKILTNRESRRDIHRLIPSVQDIGTPDVETSPSVPIDSAISLKNEIKVWFSAVVVVASISLSF